MSIKGYVLSGIGVLLVLAVIVFATLQEKRFSDALEKMTPEQREVALREARGDEDYILRRFGIRMTATTSNDTFGSLALGLCLFAFQHSAHAQSPSGQEVPFAACLSSCFTKSMHVGTHSLRDCLATARGQKALCQMEAYGCLLNCVGALAAADRMNSKNALPYKNACQRARRVSHDPETRCAAMPRLD